MRLYRGRGAGCMFFLLGVGIVYFLHMLILPTYEPEDTPEPTRLIKHKAIPPEVQEKIDRIRQAKLHGFPLERVEGNAATRQAPIRHHDNMFQDLEAAHRAVMEGDSDEEGDEEDSDEDYRPRKQKHVTIRRGNKTMLAKKVILVTYMRGGSTFLGEIFNQNKDAFIWFEPLDAVYSSMYGTNYGWHPPDIFFDEHLDLRDMPDFEKAAIISAVNQIFSCDISSLPTQVPTHSFFYFIKTVLNNKDYQKCMGPTHSWKCMGGFAKKICPNRRFPAADANTSHSLTIPECHDLMVDIQKDNPLDTHMDKLYSRSKSLHDKPRDEVYEDLLATIKTYSQCMNTVRAKGEQCYPQLQKYCNDTAIRVIKAIRLRMRTVKQILDADEDAMAVLMFRDPRGIIASRFKAHFVSSNARSSKLREAEMLCKKMAEDYKIYSDMLVRSDYDNRVVMLKYENVAQDPLNVAKRVYWNLLHMEVPDQVHSWLNSSVSGAADTGKMGTVRKNGTMTANKWMESLTRDEIEHITEICAPVLRKLRYPIDLWT